jgi:hypothetical protein
VEWKRHGDDGQMPKEVKAKIIGDFSLLPENEFDGEPEDDQSFHVEESHVS